MIINRWREDSMIHSYSSEQKLVRKKKPLWFGPRMYNICEKLTKSLLCQNQYCSIEIFKNNTQTQVHSWNAHRTYKHQALNTLKLTTHVKWIMWNNENNNSTQQ
jgi:hypothetical protein